MVLNTGVNEKGINYIVCSCCCRCSVDSGVEIVTGNRSNNFSVILIHVVVFATPCICDTPSTILIKSSKFHEGQFYVTLNTKNYEITEDFNRLCLCLIPTVMAAVFLSLGTHSTSQLAKIYIWKARESSKAFTLHEGQ